MTTPVEPSREPIGHARDPAAISEDDRVHEIVRNGPSGTFAVAGVATAIVVLIYIAFYFVVYLPRGAVQ